MLIVHFENLKTDMLGQIRRIAAFLDIPIDEKRWPSILEHCSFAYMKAQAARVLAGRDSIFKGGPADFIYKGTNGRWKDVLTVDDCRRYEAMAREQLGEACAKWLATGNLPS